MCLIMVWKGFNILYTLICNCCGKEYGSYNNKSKYCSDDCYNKQRSKKEKLNKLVCLYCGKTFETYQKDKKYCCKECATKSQTKKVYCSCDNCGKEIVKKRFEFLKNKHNFCSRKCLDEYFGWDESDINILKNNYRKIPLSDIQSKLNKHYSLKAIKSKATALGLSRSRLWSDDEIKILKENYSKIPKSEISKLLPNRTYVSIKRKAESFGLICFESINKYYSNDDNKYLSENYMELSNEELALHLNRTPYAIEQRLRVLGLHRPIEIQKEGYKDLNKFIRSRITTWKDNYRRQCNYTCCVTGEHSNIVVHHCRSFNLLLDEAIKKIDFEIKDTFNEYDDVQLELLAKTFIEIQEKYGEYVCISEKIHRLFHKIYGYGNNTIEQWNEFIQDYKNNKIKPL